MINNKTTGTRFEREFATILADNWFWVHLFQDNKNGQPCDVIAARNGHTYLFDCKNCETDRFPLSRMEENQYNSMKLFELTGNSRGMLAIRFSEREIYLVGYWVVKALAGRGIRSIDRETCRRQGVDFWEWLNERNRIDGWSGEHADHNWQ